MKNEKKVFRSMEQYKKYYFPKTFEKERKAKLSPSERGKEEAKEDFKKIMEKLERKE